MAKKDFDPRKFQSYFEKVADTNVKAFEAQTRYFQSLLKRNAALMSEITANRVSKLKDLAASRDLSTAIKSTSESNHHTKEKMQQLYEENLAAWEELQTELKELYAIDNDIISQMQKSTKGLVASAKSRIKDMAPKKKAGEAAPKPAKVKPATTKSVAARPAAKKAAPRKAPASKAET
ncbi:MAG: hypothetical protein VR73_07525 [Gammaproteobacteria bacterium BRH_c0]|nr:MAG: hypothetical protein VR73_07525 [Gammaproteobacteria bacterium BRH_c0]